jgi:hypothetical protein
MSPLRAISLKHKLACVRGKISIKKATTLGRCSGEKKVPHKKDMGRMIKVLKFPISSWELMVIAAITPKALNKKQVRIITRNN